MADLPTDTELLDWLDEQTTMRVFLPGGGVRMTWLTDTALASADGSDIRQAITAAMEKQRKEGHD